MQKPLECHGCSLENLSDGFLESEGEGTSGVVIVGEGGGYNEYIDGLPFRPHAQAGSKLEEAFRLAGQDLRQPCNRNQFLLYNLVNCHPPGDKLSGASYEQSAIEHCKVHFNRVVGGFRTPFTKTILALGNLPLKYLCGFTGVAKEKQSISHLRGFVFPSEYGMVVPSYHPSYIRRGKGHLTPLLVDDIKKALAVAKGLWNGYPSHKDFIAPIYNTSPGLDDAWSFYYKVRDNPNLVLTYDIETNETSDVDEDERDDLGSNDIVLVQFSIAKGTGIAFPFAGEYLPVISELFKLNNPKANHNTWNFDNPRLKAKGLILNGKIHDTMWMFKHWHPRLPRGLQAVASLFRFPFPWKQLYSANLPWYGCADVDAVQWIISVLPKLMKERGVWEGYINSVYRVHTITDGAREKGIPVSEEARGKLEIDFRNRREEVNQELQTIIPDEIKNIKPKRVDKKTGEISYGYIKTPKIIRKEVGRYDYLYQQITASGRQCVDFDKYIRRKHNLVQGRFEEVNDSGEVTDTVERWCIIKPFKASKDQMVRYLKWKQEGIKEEIEKYKQERIEKFGGRNPELTAKIREAEELLEDYAIPISLKTKKETTSKDELDEMFLNTGDPVLEKVVRIRSYDTNINNYLQNWKPGRDGRVHPTFGFTAPQGQINTWRPNSQNVSKHTDFGQEFRSIIVAPPGHCFVELDKKSFHVGTMGYCANDRGYIRFSQIDPHSILGSYIDPGMIGQSISLKWSDADIKEAAKEFKRRSKEQGENGGVDVRQALAKPTVLGNQLELGPIKLQRQNRRYIHHVRKATRLYHRDSGLSAEELQQIVADLFNKVEVFKKFIKQKAFTDKFLIDEFQRIQYFYDVISFSYNKKTRQWTSRDGEGAREPVAFRVQGTAFGMITEELVTLDNLGACEEFNWIDTIHDSHIFMPEIGKRDKCIEIAYDVMNRPCKRLVNEATGPEGLKVGVEVAVGRNWKNWNRDSNPEGMKEIKV